MLFYLIVLLNCKNSNASSEMESQETFILLKFKNGELGMGMLEFIKKPVLHVGVFSIFAQVQKLICDQTEIAVIWPKNHVSSFIIPVLEPNCKWPMKSATLIECSNEKRVIIEKRNSLGPLKSKNLNSQQVREAVTADEEEMFVGEDSFDSDSEDFNESPDDETKKTPSALISIADESQIWPASSNVCVVDRNDFNLSVRDVPRKKKAALTPLSNVPCTPPSTPLNSLNDEQQNQHHQQTPTTGKRSIAQENVQLKRKIAKLEEDLATMEDVIKMKGEEIQVLEEELAASKANLLDTPVNLSNCLKENLQLLKQIISTTERRNQQQDRPRDNTAGGIQKVKLSRSCETLVNPNALKNAVSYGKGGKKVADMNAMINVLMEDLWDRAFMAHHSLSGKKAKNDKSDVPPKPALPADPVQAIINYVTEFWEKHYSIQVETQQIRSSISTKLSTENSAYKKRTSAILARCDGATSDAGFHHPGHSEDDETLI